MSRRKADLAKRAIDYLVQHDFKLHWGYDPAEPPPEEVRRLLRPYLDDPEVELTTGALLCDYLVSRLREDWLLTGGQDRTSCSRPTCRVVWGD
jgi:hypothetical protein